MPETVAGIRLHSPETAARLSQVTLSDSDGGLFATWPRHSDSPLLGHLTRNFPSRDSPPLVPAGQARPGGDTGAVSRRAPTWRHGVRVYSLFSSPSHGRLGTSRCASPGFVKTGIANNCEYQGTVRNISAKYRAFRSEISLRKYGEMHRISRIFDCVMTT